MSLGPGQECEEKMVLPSLWLGTGNKPPRPCSGSGEPARPLHRTGEMGDFARSLGPLPTHEPGWWKAV